MDAEIYLEEYTEIENRYLVIESDHHAVWAYVLDENNQIEFDGFLFSRGTFVDSSENIKEFIGKGFQPPLMKSFANEFSVQRRMTNENLKIVWESSLVRNLIDNVEFSRMDTLNRISYSKATSKKGP